ncbi:MAG: divergent polysaccharide deacetylase family protein [Candidatus Acidiferrales bacterium]
MHSRKALRIFAGLAAALLLFLAGCSKKSLSKSELRSVTGEIVAVAQKINGRKSEIAIRPELQPTKTGASTRLTTDNIYISLLDPAQASTLTQALTAVAQRHKLAITETTSPGVIRFDFSFHGARTHTVHVVTPLAPRAHPPVTENRGSSSNNSGDEKNPRLAIIIDDLGYDRSSADAVLALGFPLTVSVLPHLPLSNEVAEEAQRRGDQVMLHLPMESEADGAKPEDIELRVGMNASQVGETLAGMLETVPYAVGVNNHQGSRATADPALMQALMPALRQRGLFFIDSRTDAKTVAYDTAERNGVRAASRKVFLDDVASREAILRQLELAARDARRDGFTIAIGHPRPATIAALSDGVPHLEANGIHLVFASQLVQ